MDNLKREWEREDLSISKAMRVALMGKDFLSTVAYVLASLI